MVDFVAHLTRQFVFSRATFGPKPRTQGVIQHIKKELKEVEECYAQGYDETIAHSEASLEWVDVVILGLDGLMRSISAEHPDMTADQVADLAAWRIRRKQGTNEMRDWPDWRHMPEDAAIEHTRT